MNETSSLRKLETSSFETFSFQDYSFETNTYTISIDTKYSYLYETNVLMLFRRSTCK